jgi:hypothetical protein
MKYEYEAVTERHSKEKTSVLGEKFVYHIFHVDWRATKPTPPVVRDRLLTA